MNDQRNEQPGVSQMKITYQSKDYAPEKILKRYVSCHIYGEFFVSEVGYDKRYDLRQGYVLAHELPENIRTKAQELRGQAFNAVEWPF
jgi:hypothetical protein